MTSALRTVSMAGRPAAVNGHQLPREREDGSPSATQQACRPRITAVDRRREDHFGSVGSSDE